MSKFTFASKTAALIAVTMPLALVACGSDDSSSEAEGESTTTATATSATTASIVPSLALNLSESASAPASSAAANPGAASGAAEPNAAAPNDPAPAADPAPAPAGASGADTEQISNLVTGMAQQATLKDLTTYMGNNLCQQVIAEQGGPEAYSTENLPDISMNEVSDWSNQSPEIANVQVNGDSATADVTTYSQAGAETESWTFARENNQWKICR